MSQKAPSRATIPGHPLHMAHSRYSCVSCIFFATYRLSSAVAQNYVVHTGDFKKEAV